MKKFLLDLNESEIATSRSRSALTQQVRRLGAESGKEVVATEVSEIVIPVNQHYTIVRDGQSYDEGDTFYY